MQFERFETEANLLPEGFQNFDDYSNWHCRYVLGLLKFRAFYHSCTTVDILISKSSILKGIIDRD